MKKFGSLILLFLIVVVSAGIAMAKDHPLEPVDLSSPRATLTSFVELSDEAYEIINGRNKSSLRSDHVAKAHVEKLLKCLDLSHIPEFRRESKGKEAALCLKEILDRIDLPDWKTVPDLAALENLDAPPTVWRMPHTSIVMSRVELEAGIDAYRFSAETVANAKNTFLQVKNLPYKEGSTPHFLEWYLSEPGSAWLSWVVKRLPSIARKRVGGAAIWQWGGVVMMFVLSATIMMSCYRAGRYMLRRGAEKHPFVYGMTLVFPIVAMLTPLCSKHFIINQMNVVGDMLAVVTFLSNIIFLFALVIVVLGTGVRVAGIITAAPSMRSDGIDAQFVRLLCRILSIVASFIFFIEVGKYMGLPLSSLLAGAGVGGVAVALAAQDMLKNVFGSIMIFLDKPYVVGERIAVGGYDGKVEEIGLRSTRIRQLNGHLTTVPNETMARSSVENIGRRPFVRRTMDLYLPLDIGVAKSQRAMDICAEILKDHDGQEAGRTPRIFLNEFLRDCITLRIMYWFHPPEHKKFVAFGHKVNQQIMERFEAANIRFALPTSLSHFTQDNPVQSNAESGIGRSE